MDSATKLYAISQAKPNGNGYSIFPGTHMHCTKKATDYSNCCKVGKGDLLNNWGHNIGAHCTRDEKQLLENRQKNLCVYVGKSGKGGNRTERNTGNCPGATTQNGRRGEDSSKRDWTHGNYSTRRCRGRTSLPPNRGDRLRTMGTKETLQL